VVRYFLICALLIGCGHNKDDFSQREGISETSESKLPAAPVHYYSVYLDGEYGYQPEISENQAKDGQVGATLVMLKYLGERNGTYQIFSKENESFMTVMECKKPCEFIKVHHIVKGLGVVKTDVLQAAPNSIGKLAFDDAMSGQLEQFVKVEGNKKYTVWLNEKKHMQKTLVQ